MIATRGSSGNVMERHDTPPTTHGKQHRPFVNVTVIAPQISNGNDRYVSCPALRRYVGMYVCMYGCKVKARAAVGR